jgi:hypothetical protein
MPISSREARQLSTAGEWTLVESSLPAILSTLSPARLKAKIERARKLRNKYADLAKRQHRTARPKRSGQPKEALNARTKRKAELFAQVLSRYEARLALLAAKGVKAPEGARGRAARARKKQASRGTKGTKGTKGTGSTKGEPRAPGKRRLAAEAAKATKATRAAREANAKAAQRGATSVVPHSKVKESRAPLVPKSALSNRSGQHRMHAHVSSRGRRRQGRRDNR